MEFYATSAKSGENVENMFEDIAFKVMTKAQLKKEQQARTQNAGTAANGQAAVQESNVNLGSNQKNGN